VNDSKPSLTVNISDFIGSYDPYRVPRTAHHAPSDASNERRSNQSTLGSDRNQIWFSSCSLEYRFPDGVRSLCVDNVISSYASRLCLIYPFSGCFFRCYPVPLEFFSIESCCRQCRVRRI